MLSSLRSCAVRHPRPNPHLSNLSQSLPGRLGANKSLLHATAGELLAAASVLLPLGAAAGWRACSANYTLEQRLKRRAQRAEALALEAAEHAAGDASVPCTGEREFPVKLSDTALYVTDMQGDFLLPEGRIGKFYSPEDLAKMDPVIQNCERLVAAAREAGMTVAYGRSHRFGAEIRRDLICPSDSSDTYNVVESLRPQKGDIVVDKWTWGIFASTDLEEQLRERGIRRLIVCGIATNVCVTNMVFQAVDRFFRVCLIPEACGAFDAAWHDHAIAMLNGPQIKAGHSAVVDNTGLYFCETSTVDAVEATLRALLEEEKDNSARSTDHEDVPEF